MVASFEASISRDPKDHRAYFNMGLWWHWKRKYSEAIELFDKAIEINPGFAWALCARAGLRATCPDSRYRDGKGAIADAQLALELADARGDLETEWVHRTYLQTLAAAYAEAGDFDTAVDHQNKVLGLAVTRTAKQVALPRLEKYQSSKPIEEEAGLITNNPAWLWKD